MLSSSEPISSRPITDALRVAADLLRPRTLRSVRDQHQRPQHAGQPAAAAEDADAAEQRDGDDVELEAERVVGAGIGEPRGEDDAGERADQPGDDEQHEAQAAAAHAGIAGGVGIAADGVDAPADRA